MKKQMIFMSIAIVGLLATACKTMQIEKPNESYLPSNLAPALSELPLQVELDVKKLESSINKKMTGVIYEGSNISNKDLKIRVEKAQNFTFTINNNVIEYRVPLKVWSRFAWKVEKFGYAVGDNYEANGAIALTYKTTISFDKNWKLVSKTIGAGYEWLQTPRLNVVGVNVPVTPIANLALSQCDKLITAQIDKSLSESIDLKKYVSQAWAEVQKPREVNPENNLWIRITPKDVYVSPFTSTGNKLNLAVALYAQIESFLGAQPAANPVTPLPAFKYVNRPAQQFNLNIGGDVTFDKISDLAKKQLLNKTFSEGNKKITITDLSIFGSEGKAVFVADVIGSFKGRIYFTGNMVYNAEKIAMEITNPEFSVKTSNVLVKSASWLLHGMILKQLTPYLTYPVKTDLESMKTQVNKMIGNYTVMDGVSLQGKLNNLSVTSLSLVPGAVRIQANVKGNVALKIQELKF
ncbi:DUF4403 family protein [Paludibacter propionicigenes]|nr:DUF4403 family protein [Paludibacter propionicigenes]